MKPIATSTSDFATLIKKGAVARSAAKAVRQAACQRMLIDKYLEIV
jgi:hypothetical protein